MRRAVALAVLVTILAPPARASAAAPLPALPAVVRVNVTPQGLGRTVIASSGTIVVRAPDGGVAYSGTQRLVVRTNVRRVEGADLALAEAPARVSPAERAERLLAIRDARVALDLARTWASIVAVPFEVAALAARTSAVADAVFTAQRPERVTFAATGGLLSVNGRLFRGTLEVALGDDGRPIVVNAVATGDYLASVVGSEVPPSWEPEALAAQAIAARTYLYTRLGRHASYDLEGDTRDQAYDGVAAEAPSTREAVARTAGVIATYRGAPIEALYSANAGGVTEDSENVFGVAQPYLRSVPSPTDAIAAETSWAATSYEWTRELTAAQLGDELRSRGVDVGLPLRIELLAVSGAGRVTSARVVGTSGTQDIGRDRTRYYFGLRSTLFTVVVRSGGEPEWVSADDEVRLADMAALGALRVRGRYEHVVDEWGRPLGIRFVEWLYVLPARFAFAGRGFGHGVGLSQWGAQGMAVAGASAEQILRHYYTGIALAQVGGG